MKKALAVSAGLIVIVLGVGYWLISPLFIDKEVSEKLEDIAPTPSSEEAAIPTTVKTGSFEGLAGHSAGGTARLVKVGAGYYIRFEDDFQITNGPDLFVHFGKDGSYDSEARLGELRGNIGGQNYMVPSSINVENYNEVWVWCRSFRTPFGKASLK